MWKNNKVEPFKKIDFYYQEKKFIKFMKNIYDKSKLVQGKYNFTFFDQAYLNWTAIKKDNLPLESINELN